VSSLERSLHSHEHLQRYIRNITFRQFPELDLQQIINKIFPHSPSTKIAYQLRILNLYLCTSIKDEMLQSIITSTSSLKSLCLAGCVQVSNRAICSVISPLCPNLQVLDVRLCCKLTDVSLQHLVTACPKLIHLNLAGTGISDHGLRMILNECVYLKELSVASTKVSDHGFHQLQTRKTNLQILSVHGCRNISLLWLKSLPFSTSLTSLDLTECPLISEHFKFMRSTDPTSLCAFRPVMRDTIIQMYKMQQNGIRFHFDPFDFQIWQQLTTEIAKSFTATNSVAVSVN
jgi:hypothetical protein